MKIMVRSNYHDATIIKVLYSRKIYKSTLLLYILITLVHTYLTSLTLP